MFKRAESEVQRDEQVLFPRPEELTSPAPTKSPVTATANLSILPKGAKFEGTFKTDGTLRIDGEFKGSITAAGDATLAPGSRVEADIQAQNVVVGGHHKGTLIARNRATLGDAARVVGTISCRGLVITEGAWFDGKLSMGPPPESLERQENKGGKVN
jgi:cytoskeletal protein CcmA (bactofilin family)